MWYSCAMDPRGALATERIERLETASGPAGLRRFGTTVGEALQLVEHEARDEEIPGEHPGAHEAREATVHDRRGVDEVAVARVEGLGADEGTEIGRAHV